MSTLFAWLLIAALLSAISPAKSHKRTSARSQRASSSTVTTVKIRPDRQPAQKQPPAFDMEYEYDYAAQQYYCLAESLMRDAKRETDKTKANRLKCRAAEALLKADRHALKAQQ